MGFEQLKLAVKRQPKMSISAAWAADPPVLQAIDDAVKMEIIDQVILTGPVQAITLAAEQANVAIEGWQIDEALSPEDAARLSVEHVRSGRADVLMKGLLSTAILLRAVLNKQDGLRNKPLLSHIGIIEFPDKSLRLLTDGGMNIAPDLEQKIQIIENAVEAAVQLKIGEPKVALLASVETVNPKMPETIDAAVITQMFRRGQLHVHSGTEIDGPLAFDNAISSEAAAHKGIQSSTAGYANILVVPEINAGNMLYKSFVYMAGLASGGLVWGAACPIIVTSRADSREAKLNSIAAACLAASQGRRS